MSWLFAVDLYIIARSDGFVKCFLKKICYYFLLLVDPFSADQAGCKEAGADEAVDFDGDPYAGDSQVQDMGGDPDQSDTQAPHTEDAYHKGEIYVSGAAADASGHYCEAEEDLCGSSDAKGNAAKGDHLRIVRKQVDDGPGEDGYRDTGRQIEKSV